MTHKNAVFFDLDDTLFKELDFLKSAYREISDFVETNTGAVCVFDAMMGWWKDNRDVFSSLLETYKPKGISKEKLLAIYRNHKPALTLPNDSHFLLNYLKGRCLLGIISDGRSVSQRNKITALGLNEYIDGRFIFISEETGEDKLSFKPFKRVRDLSDAEVFWYIADNIDKDFVPARESGWRTIGLLDDGRNIHPHHILPASMGPDFWVSSLREVILLIDIDGSDQ